MLQGAGGQVVEGEGLVADVWLRTGRLQLQELWKVENDRVENHGDDEVSGTVVVPAPQFVCQINVGKIQSFFFPLRTLRWVKFGLSTKLNSVSNFISLLLTLFDHFLIRPTFAVNPYLIFEPCHNLWCFVGL